MSEVIVVEGRYDKNTVSQVVNATIVEIGGFGVFNDKEKTAFLRRLAEKQGIIVFTDSDGAGFVIRNHLKSVVQNGRVLQAYIPDVYGKERRKAKAGKEGKLGVEGMTPEVILKALRDAGATFDGIAADVKGEGITAADFMERGLVGDGSAQRRAKLWKMLDFPAHISTKAALEAINLLMTKEEFYALEL
ncbi:MAG: DUF4093 domain-containing protein [Oscillospiraceae bacterium]|nr:DUF4093 domain-containing protein [Oscillospiraceae bacterium]